MHACVAGDVISAAGDPRDNTYSLIDTFADADDLLSVAPLLDGDQTLLFGSIEDLDDSLGNIKDVTFGRDFAVLLHFTRGGEELEEVAIDGEAGVLGFDHNGAWDHITSTESLFVLLVGEDVLSGDHGLGRAVLAGLGGGESSDLAWELTLHHDQGTWLHAASFSQLDVGRAGITLFELVVRHLN